MPYTKKRGMTRRRKQPAQKRNKKYIKKARSSYAQQKQLLSIQRQVNFTNNKLRDRAQYAQFDCPLDDADGGTSGTQKTLPNGAFYITDLIKPNLYTPIFQSTSTITLTNKFQFSSFDIQLLFSPKNSEAPLTPRVVRVWILSLRDETAQKTLNETNNMTGAGLDASPVREYVYKTTSDGGLDTLVKFNPAAFKIHAYREFLMGNILNETANILDSDEDQPSANLTDPIKRCRIKFGMRNKLKPPTESWRTMTPAQIMPKDRRYLCVHVGGWGGAGVDGDNEVVMNTNIVANGRLTN